MKFEIKHRYSGVVLFSLETTDLRLAVEAAVKNKANLSKANLSKANLSEANLSKANLSKANLSKANLSKADLSKANLTQIRDDLWAVLSAVPAEAEGLRLALLEGRVNGTAYEGECACLVGTIANIRGCSYKSLANLAPNSARSSERFFLNIAPGHTPETSPVVKQVVEWIDVWLSNMRSAFSTSGKD